MNLKTDGDEDVEDDEDDEDGDEEDGADAMEDIMAALSPPIRARVEKLIDLERGHEELFAQYQAERCALEMKYQVLYDGIYDKRAAIVAGREGGSGEDEEGAGAAGTTSDVSPRAAATEFEPVGEKKGVPKFWLQAMVHRAILRNLLHQTDVEAMSYLEDIRCVDEADMTGFQLRFTFAENPYFTNRVLTKSYRVPNLMKDEEPMLEKVEGCDIDWRPNKSLTYEEKTKKQRAKKGKNKGQTRIVTEKVPKESFFSFFDTLDVEKMENCANQEEAEEMMDRFNMDYTAASFLRNEFIPHAVLNFTSQAGDDDSDDEDYDDDDDDDDDDDNEEDEDEDEDGDVDASGPRRSKRRGGNGDGGRGGGRGGAGGLSRSKGAPSLHAKGADGADPECKQS